MRTLAIVGIAVLLVAAVAGSGGAVATLVLVFAVAAPAAALFALARPSIPRALSPLRLASADRAPPRGAHA